MYNKTLEERRREYERREQLRRINFFRTLGIEDDGRRCPEMTREEYRLFRADKEYYGDKERLPGGCVVIYTDFEAYHDLTVYYDPATKKLKEVRFYVGD